MSFIRSFFLLGCICLLQQAVAQQPTVKILESGKRISIRGLSVVTDKIIWASGSAGSVARSVDGGNTFTWTTVPGYEKNDFRDIEAFDENTAIIMGITAPAVILKTTDGGKNWKKVFEDTTKGAFFDAMDFLSEKEGTVVGDPINDKLFIARTYDKGENWSTLPTKESFLQMAKGEAFFASSGTNVRTVKTGLKGFMFLLVSGGKKSRIFDQQGLDSIPIMQGTESTGANSIDYDPKTNKAVIVGGDFTKDTISHNNCVLVSFANKYSSFIFTKPQTPPHGYRSCVIYLEKDKLLTCGTSGIDISKDGGMNWELISTNSFHVCQKAKKGKAVFLAGGGGRIAKLILP